MRPLSVLALLTLAGTVPAADPPAPSARLGSVAINRPPGDFAPDLSGSPYTNVGVLAVLPQRSVICLDPAACRITFTDDKGTDLTAGRTRSVLSPAVWTDASKSQVRFTVSTRKLPADGATRVRLKGDLVLLCGTGEKTATAELTVRAGEKVTLGPAVIEVTVGGNQTHIKLTATDPLVKSVTLLDRDGNPVEPLLYSVVTNTDGKTYQCGSAQVPPNTPAVTVRVVHYEKAEPVTVPIDAAMGVGR